MFYESIINIYIKPTTDWSAFWGDPFLSCIPDFTTGREYCQPAYQALLSPGAPAVERRALKMNIIWSDGAAEWKDIMNYGARDSWMMWRGGGGTN
ncbi:hypothetical protein EVAR_76030_1 [Eumeta japonica]|uniref:Uncharacterized protein n=1 Tax=Eumeta variegata TaxID=151549 RepID=A0A4C1UA76_EUMVA|nr:hypothetical protein EVAR_76030_1 [Eumeta japonica]